MPALASLVIVVEAPNPDQAEDAARELAERLRKTKDIKGPIKYLAADPFFAKNGLLYLNPQDLEELANRLADAQPLLASLSADPSLRGLFNVLTLALNQMEKGGNAPPGLHRILDHLSVVAEARAKGGADELSWRRLISGKASDSKIAREFIRVGIELDFSSLGPARQSMKIVRKVAEVAALTPEHGIRVRITGGNAMATEELGSVTAEHKKPADFVGTCCVNAFHWPRLFKISACNTDYSCHRPNLDCWFCNRCCWTSKSNFSCFCSTFYWSWC